MDSFRKFLDETVVQEAYQYNIDNDLPLEECLFRYGSEKYFEYFLELKNLYENDLIEEDLLTEDLLDILTSDIGSYGIYEGEEVLLDVIFEADYHGTSVELNKPKRGGSRKFVVYTKNPATGNVKKIEFGDTTGLSVKYNDPERKKSFAARHRCSDQTDRTSRAYWACRVNKYLGKSAQARAGYW